MQAKIKILSLDKALSGNIEKINKIQALRLWCSKSLGFLIRYEETIKEMDGTKGPTQDGILIERLEAMLTSAVTTYLRCFHKQKGFRFSISDITRDPVLLQTFAELNELRNDELVHCQGLNSSYEVVFNMDLSNPAEAKLLPDIDIRYSDKIGFPSIENFKKLIEESIANLDRVQAASIEAMAEKFKNSDIWRTTDLVNPDNHVSIFVERKVAPLFPILFPK